jgi:hypothetical protein
VACAKGPVNQDKLKQRYRQLLNATSRVVGQAKRFSEEIVRGVKRSTNALKLLVLKALRQELDEIQSFDATGAHFGQPGYETDLLYLAGLLALCLGGPGPISVDALLSRLQTSRGSQA